MNRPVRNQEVIAVAVASLTVALTANLVTFFATRGSIHRNANTISFLCDTRDIDDTVVKAMNKLLEPAPKSNVALQDFREQLRVAHNRLHRPGPCDDQAYQPSPQSDSSRSK